MGQSCRGGVIVVNRTGQNITVSYRNNAPNGSIYPGFILMQRCALRVTTTLTWARADIMAQSKE
jgi:hypothetical protein